MSLYKQINGKNNDRDFLEKKRKYITDPVKTDGGKLVGSSACFSEHGIDDWISVKKAYHTTGGKQGEHITISLTPERVNVSNEKYMIVAEEIAKSLFGGYNCIYALHIDSTYRHFHFLINSVSYIDGKRFHSSKSDLANTRLAVNRVLEKHNFDIIRASTDTMIDETPYDLENGFEVLEITDDKPYEDPFKDILVEDIDDEELYDYLDGKKPKNEGEYFIMNYNGSSVNNKNTFETAPAANTTHWIAPQPVQSYPPQYIPQYAAQPVPLYMTQPAPQYLPQIPPQYSMQLAQQYPMLPESQYTQQSAYQYIFQPTPQYSPQPEYQYTPQPGQPAQTPPVAFPTMMLNFSSRITINATQSTTIQEIKDYLNAATPKVSSSNLFKYAVVMASELERRNIQMNIEANLFPDITINMTGADDDSDENKVIDVEQD